MPADEIVPDTATESPAAIALLLREHEDGRARLEALLAAVDAHNDLAVAAPIVLNAIEYLQSSLELHIAREEGLLFPLLKAAMPPGDRLIDEMIAEHDLIRVKREELREIIDDLLSGHDDVRADLEALRDLARAASDGVPSDLQHAAHDLAQKMRVHFENEEELVFPLAPRLLAAETLARIYEEMRALG